MHYGKTRVVVCGDAVDLGRTAAAAVGQAMREALAERGRVHVIFAAGESQITFFDAMAAQEGIDWARAVCFNLDDLWDPRMPERYTCGYQARRQLYDRVRPGRVELVRFNASDAQAEADRFAGLMREVGSFDLVCLGIGTSGHLALNEPGDTDFEDQALVRVVDLAAQSKRQLIEDPNFNGLGYIPDKGITMTIPALMAAGRKFTIVPLGLKRPILTRVLGTPTPTADLPATILSRYEGTLFMDRDSCPEAWLERL